MHTDRPNTPRMRRETLHALVVDEACSELSPEVAELLGLWLSCNPEDEREAGHIRAAVTLAEQARRTAEATREPARGRPAWPLATALAVAASVAVVVAIGRTPSRAGGQRMAEPPIAWTRYELAGDNAGRLTIKPQSADGVGL